MSNYNPMTSFNIITVVIVDDDEKLLQLVSTVISRKGYQTICFGSGSEAIEYISVKREVILILDNKLPDMTGQMLIETLKGKGIEVPFVVMTGQGSERLAVEMMKLGATDYLIKDTNMLDILPNVVERLVEFINTKKQLKEVKELLHEKENFYKDIFESSSDALFIHSAKDLRIESVNSSVLQMYGIKSLNEALSCTVESLSAADEGYNSEKLSEVIHTTNAQGSNKFEWYARKFNGEKFWVEVNLRKVTIGGEIKILANVRDIHQRKLYENSLRDSEMQFRSIFENAADAIFIADIESGTILDVNRRAESLLKVSRNNIIGKNQIDLHPVDYRDYSKKGFKDHIKKLRSGSKAGITIEGLVQKSDGEIAVVEIVSSIVSYGGKQCLMGFFRDITERKRAEESLRIQSLVLDQIRDLVTITDLNGIITYVNQAVLKSSKRSKEEIIGQPTIIYGENSELGVTQNQILTETLAKGIWQGEVVNYSSDGDMIKVDCRTQVIRDENGNPFALCGVSHDITERKLVESQLRKLSRAVEQSPSMVVITNLDGNIEYVNPKFTEITGYTLNEVIGKKTSLLKSGEQSPTFYKKLWDAILSREEWRGEFHNKKKNGELFWVSASISPIFDEDNKIINFIAIKEDITEKKRIESDLIIAKENAEKSNANVKAIIENTNDSIWAINKDYNLTYVNRVFKNDFFNAFGKELIIGEDVNSKLPLPLQKLWHNRYARALAGEQYIVEDVVNDTPDPIYIQISMNPIISNDEVIGAAFFGKNITLQKKQELEIIKAKEKAEESDRNIKTLFDILPIGLALTKATGELVYVNREYINILGYSEEELLKLTYFDVTPKKYAKDEEKQLNDLNEKGFYGPYEKEYVNKSGVLVPVLLNGKYVTIDNEKFIWSSVENISQRKLYEIELVTAKEVAEESEKQFRQLFENMEQGFALHEMIYDIENKPIDYRFILTNRSFEKLLGINANDFIGKTVKEVLPHTEQIWIENFGKVAQTGIPIHFENYSQEFNRYFDVVTYSPKQNYFAVVFTDVTENKVYQQELIKAKEQAERSDQLKTSFLHNMSHEVRTPLNAIVGFCERMTNKNVSDEKRDFYSSIIVESSYQLLSIVDDILTISTIDTGQEEVYIEEFDVENTISQAISKNEKQAQRKSLSIHFKQLNAESKTVIKTDKYKLLQILNNLLSNAVKFTHKGQIVINYSINNGQLELYVSDTGIGIPEDKLEAIFERFVQADETIHTDYGGTGLGLSICKGYVEMLGGKIWAESKVGKGTIIRFTIPLGERIKHEIHKLKEDVIINKKKNIKVLVVEDQEFNFVYIEEFLLDYNCIVLHAWDGKQAIEKCSENPDIDLVLMDIKMPNLDGYRATEMIKQIRPKLPVVAQTAYATQDEINKFSGIFDEYITKPLSEDKLQLIFSQFVRR